jgi:hypothetical protein
MTVVMLRLMMILMTMVMMLLTLMMTTLPIKRMVATVVLVTSGDHDDQNGDAEDCHYDVDDEEG